MHVMRMNDPPPPGPGLPIIRIKAKQQFLAIILCREIFGFMCHWAGKATVPCTSQPLGCAGCNARPPWPSRWKGYLHVLEMSSRKQGFLEITPASAEMIRLQTVKGVSLRGNVLEAFRSDANNGRLKIVFKSVFPRPDELPEAIDPLPALKKLWGIDEQQ